MIFSRIAFRFGRKRPYLGDLAFIAYSIPGFIALSRIIATASMKAFGCIPRWLSLFTIGFSRASLALVFRTRNALMDRSAISNFVSELRTKGYVDLTESLSITVDEIEKVKAHFYASRAYNSQVVLQSDLETHTVEELRTRGVNYMSFPLDISLADTVIRRIISSPLCKQIADEYLCFDAKLYSVNTMLTVPAEARHAVTDQHRDFDDLRFLAFFIYWTDVARDNGATFFVPGSHRSPVTEGGLYIEGKAGKVVAIDAFGLHAGNKNLQTDRLATWFRYGRIPNFVYITDKTYVFAEQLREVNAKV